LQRKREEEDLPDSSARFVWNKYKALFLPLLFSAFSGFKRLTSITIGDSVTMAVRNGDF